VRVIAGELRGRRIVVPKGAELRPTYDRARESLFSMIADRLRDARVLDLFAGTGSLGIESVSRGAAEAVFVERDPQLVGHLGVTVREFGIDARCRVVRSDALRFVAEPLRGRRPFDVVFADPPYDSGLARRVYDALGDWDGVAPGGLVVIEHRAGDRLPEAGGRMTLRTVKRYGTIEVELHDVAIDSGGAGR
jgi:16S rRNA (guanine966-N2)-methyltransferase